MNKLIINRRQFLKIGLSSGALAILPFGCIMVSDDDLDELLKFVSDSDLPVNHKHIGELSNFDFGMLSTLCKYVNKAWELTPNIDKYLERLQEDLYFKTMKEPSYLTEYENAIELVNLLIKRSESIEQAWSSLLFANFGDENFRSTKLGRARNFVFSEMITHQIPISEGFKSFGLVNYRGYFGGPYTSPDSYRRGET
tara:strand:- start:2295 stop:2885 length:591 start_codon:yes stop_codon:yes gene_type:complete